MPACLLMVAVSASTSVCKGFRYYCLSPSGISSFFLCLFFHLYVRVSSCLFVCLRGYIPTSMSIPLGWKFHCAFCFVCEGEARRKILPFWNDIGGLEIHLTMTTETSVLNCEFKKKVQFQFVLWNVFHILETALIIVPTWNERVISCFMVEWQNDMYS